jgi:Helix-turn-helix domain
MSWAWSVALPPTPKLVLMALADIADDHGVCWPSHPTLAVKCSLTDRTIRRVLTLLQTQNLVIVEARFKTTGSRTSNRYRLAFDGPPDKLSGGTRTAKAVGPGRHRPGPPDIDVLGTTTEPSMEPSELPPAPSELTAPDQAGGSGDLCFPKKLTAAQRQVLRERLKIVSPVEAQQVLDELSGRLAVNQVKNPLRYCAILIERMQSGRFVYELGLDVAEARRTEIRRRAAREQAQKLAEDQLQLRGRALPPELQAAVDRARASANSRRH